MKFPNAKKGVTKLWVGSLVGIIVAAIAVIGSILLGFNNGSDVLKKTGVGVVGAGGIAGFALYISHGAWYCRCDGVRYCCGVHQHFGGGSWQTCFAYHLGRGGCFGLCWRRYPKRGGRFA